MKNFLFATLHASSIGMLCASLSAQTNHPAVSLPPLPEQFDRMTNADVFPGLTPVAIYRYRASDQRVMFTAIGSLFRTDTNSYGIIVSEHLYGIEGGTECIYAFRIARPDSRRIDGFLGNIVMSSGDMYGCDIAIATVTNSPTPIKTFSTISSAPESTVLIGYTDDVAVDRLRIKTLRSLITGISVPVVGYGLIEARARDDAGDHQAMLAIEEPGMEGKSGTVFFDRYDRIFLVSRGPVALWQAGEETAFLDRFGHLPKGITLVTGPIKLLPK